MGQGKYSVFLQLCLSFSELILLIVNFTHSVSERSPGVGNGNALQYSCLENPMDRGAWQGCKESDTNEQLNDDVVGADDELQC